MLAFVLAIPFGWFADKYGRKKLLVMLSVAFFLRVAWQLTVCMYSSLMIVNYDLRNRY
jgi:MFS family permease